jgi:hypothetical protein
MCTRRQLYRCPALSRTLFWTTLFLRHLSKPTRCLRQCGGRHRIPRQQHQRRLQISSSSRCTRSPPILCAFRPWVRQKKWWVFFRWSLLVPGVDGNLVAVAPAARLPTDDGLLLLRRCVARGNCVNGQLSAAAGRHPAQTLVREVCKNLATWRSVRNNFRRLPPVEAASSFMAMMATGSASRNKCHTHLHCLAAAVMSST